MLETIIRLLKEAETDGWEVTDTVTEGWEFYFIRHQLDQNRIRNVEHLTVNVFKKFDTYLGNAKTEIPVTATEEDARHMIEMLIAEAQLVKNPIYSLNEPDGKAPRYRNGTGHPGLLHLVCGTIKHASCCNHSDAGI